MQVNTIYQGDCRDVLRDWPDGCIDVVITDPPYGVDYDYLEYEDSAANLECLVNTAFPILRRIARRIVTFCGVQNVWLYPRADWMVSYSWDTTAKYGKLGYNQWQPILCYGDDIDGFGSVNGVLKSDRIHYSGGAGIGFLSEYRNGKHPCPKPLNLMRYLVSRFTNEDDVVLDPFCGSGTTLAACEQIGRKWVGIELSSDYVEIARKRTAQRGLFAS